MNIYRLDPSKALAEPTNGNEYAMAEAFLLLACQAGASQLKFATTGGSLRIAEVIDGELYEFPQPPDGMHAPMFDQLRRVFAMSAEQTEAECELQLEASTARAHIEFRTGGAEVTILRNFDDRTVVADVLRRFWRDHAARQGVLELARYHVKETLWVLYNTARKAIHPSRGTAAA